MNARGSDPGLKTHEEARGDRDNAEEFFNGFTESRLYVGLGGTRALSADSIDGWCVFLFLIAGEKDFAVREDAAGGLEITHVWKRG